ncbi:hypothetical protein ACF068_18275 [Streptomyces sp. NPDC016309]|uniref:hypothetical protein n=1 Tax=Streptomyces sp. NPDC016309 TaxID=3364965 RepID=UPI003700495B
MPDDRDPLLSQRSALIFLLGALVGIGAGLLTWWKGAGAATALIATGTAFAAGVWFFHSTVA